MIHELCKCGHENKDHIYNEGACRPGFLCEAKCEKFESKIPARRKIVVTCLSCGSRLESTTSPCKCG